MKKENSLNKVKKGPTNIGLVQKQVKFNQNSVLIGKMFGNVSQSVNLSQTKNNISKNFAGGFKSSNNNQNLSYKKAQQQNNSLTKMNKFTVYDQFGLISQNINNNSSKSKPKYRPQNSKLVNKNDFALQQQNMVNQMKENRKKQLEKVLNNNYVNIHEYYQIANQKDRKQTAIHVKSSLQTMTLENVQAKLQAHRRQLKSIQEQYKMKKGILSDQKEQNQVSHNFFVQNNQNDPYKAYGKNQAQIYQIIKKNQKQDKKQIQFDNLWEDKIKQNPKIAQYSQKYQQYLVQKDAKNLLYGAVRDKLYKWDKFTQPEHKKSKPKEPHKLSKQKNVGKNNKSSQKSIQQNQNNSLLISHNVSQVIASKDDKFIAKYIFAQVDVDKKGLLSKQELLDYITKNQHIIKSYNIDLKWIYTDLDNFATKRKGMLNKQELGIFLSTFQRLQHPEIKLKTLQKQKKSSQKLQSNISIKNQPFQVCFSLNSYRFKKLFEALDFNQDKLLKRQQFIENIFIDEQCSKILDSIAIKIKIIQKNITYRQMISFILDDYRKQKNQKLKKSKEYITFQRFCEYFELPQTINLKFFNKKSKNVSITHEHQVFDIENQNLLILKDIFDTIPRVYQDFIVSADFIQTALMDPQVLSFQQDMCRIQSVETDLPIQTIRLTLQRMIRQTDEYIDWQTAKLFFSRRGRPLDWNQQLINKKKSIRQQKRAQSINQTLKRELILKNQFQISNKLKSQYLNQNKRNSQNNFTIPQPFKITDELNKNKNDKNVREGQKQFKNINQFKAKPLNKQIFEPKPDLIQGKVVKNTQNNKYNYENYENDRIQRALKKAQQQFEKKQQERRIKQNSNIKSWIDALNMVKQVKKKQVKSIDEISQPRMKKQKPKLTHQEQQVIDRLFKKPDIIQSVVEKQKKRQQLQKNKKIKDQMHKKQLAQKNKQAKKKAQSIKKQKQQEQKQIKNAIKDPNCQPIKKKTKVLTVQQKQAIQKSKQDRLRKQQEAKRKLIQAELQRKKKIIERQYKDPYKLINSFENEQQIFKNIFDIKLQNFILQEDLQQFQKDHQFSKKSKKQRQIYLKGVSNKFKRIIDQEKNILDQMKIKQKQQINKNLGNASRTTINVDRKKFNDDLNFHGSKALRRYRALINGTSESQVPSQFDKFSNKYPNQDLQFLKEQQQNVSQIVHEENEQQN